MMTIAVAEAIMNGSETIHFTLVLDIGLPQCKVELCW